MVKTQKEQTLAPQWEGPFQVLLTTGAAIRTKEQGWIHASRIIGPVEEPKEWTLISTPGDTKLTPKHGQGGNELGEPRQSTKELKCYIINNEEVKPSLYQQFQTPSRQVLRLLRHSPWGKTVPLQTGGSGLYQTEGPNVFALACDLYKKKITLYPDLKALLRPPPVSVHIPCLIHPNSRHCSWVEYKCIICKQNWYCIAHK